MNDKMYIPNGYYIVGYRPKPEYRFQLATMPIIKSGRDNSIHFRFKLDMDYVFSNPNAKRYLKIFSSVDDNPRYMLYPESPRDIVWSRFNEPFIPEFKRYMLIHGIQEYLPSKKMVKHYLKKRKELIKYSNIIDNLDTMNFQLVVDKYKKKKEDPNYKLTSIAAHVEDAYTEWLKNITDDSVRRKQDEIMKYILFSVMPWNGFRKLYNAIEGIVIEDTNDYNPEDFKPAPLPIVEYDGVKQFPDEYVPNRASEYLNPPEGYIYAGATGNGMYLIRINGKPQPVLCNMNDGGWMLVMDCMLAGKDYVANFVEDNKLPEHLVIDDKGVSFGGEGTAEILNYPEVYYQEMKIGFVDCQDGCGEATVEIYSPEHLFLFCESQVKDECFSDLSIDNEVVYNNNQQEQADYYVTDKLDNVQNSLTIKMKGGKRFENVRKYVKMLWLR
jgi:hypothetical protein